MWSRLRNSSSRHKGRNKIVVEIIDIELTNENKKGNSSNGKSHLLQLEHSTDHKSGAQITVDFQQQYLSPRIQAFEMLRQFSEHYPNPWQNLCSNMLKLSHHMSFQHCTFTGKRNESYVENSTSK